MNILRASVEAGRPQFEKRKEASKSCAPMGSRSLDEKINLMMRGVGGGRCSTLQISTRVAQALTGPCSMLVSPVQHGPTLAGLRASTTSSDSSTYGRAGAGVGDHIQTGALIQHPAHRSSKDTKRSVLCLPTTGFPWIDWYVWIRHTVLYWCHVIPLDHGRASCAGWVWPRKRANQLVQFWTETWAVAVRWYICPLVNFHQLTSCQSTYCQSTYHRNGPLQVNSCCPAGSSCTIRASLRSGRATARLGLLITSATQIHWTRREYSERRLGSAKYLVGTNVSIRHTMSGDGHFEGLRVPESRFQTPPFESSQRLTHVRF